MHHAAPGAHGVLADSLSGHGCQAKCHARAQVWLVEDGKVQEYPGYFEDYKDELMKEISAEMDEDEPAGPTKP